MIHFIKGFTFFEGLICLALIGICCLFTLPLGHMQQKKQLQQVKEDLSTAIHYAKNKALVEGMPIMLKPLSVSNDWSQGIAIYSLQNKNSPLQQWQWHHTQLHMTWHGFLAKPWLIFSPQLAHAANSGHFSLSLGQAKLKLVLNRFGRIASQVV